MADYQEVHADKLMRRIQRRFAPEMAEMKTLGFVEELYMGEITPALNPLLWLIVIPLAGYAYFVLRDVLTVNYKLDVITYTPCFIHEDVYCYAVVESRGVFYTTMFTDGSILETTSHNLMQSYPEHKLLRQIYAGGILSTWHFHRASVEQLVNEGRETLSLHTSRDVLSIEKRKNEIDWGNHPVTWPGSYRKKFDE